MQNFFHLAFPVRDLDEAREFYGTVLNCEEGRSSDHWIDFNFYGHQIVAHLAPESAFKKSSNPVDGHDVPVPHFGVILPTAEWQALAARLRGFNVEFVIRTAHALCGRNRRTIHDVLHRPKRQRARI